jgi:hypothetical protein
MHGSILKSKVHVTCGGELFCEMFSLILDTSFMFIACSLTWSWATDLAYTSCFPLNSTIFIMLEDNLCCIVIFMELCVNCSQYLFWLLAYVQTVKYSAWCHMWNSHCSSVRHLQMMCLVYIRSSLDKAEYPYTLSFMGHFMSEQYIKVQFSIWAIQMSIKCCHYVHSGCF